MSILVNGKKISGLGIQGLPGKSAYDAAKEGGFTGTEEEYNTQMADLKNKQNKITGAEGQIVSFNAAGDPIAIDMPLITYVAISDVAPNTNYLWIDTSDNSILKYYKNGVWVSCGAVWK